LTDGGGPGAAVGSSVGRRLARPALDRTGRERVPATVVSEPGGDEGKGKLTDLLAREMQCRSYQGGQQRRAHIVVTARTFASAGPERLSSTTTSRP